MEPITSAAARLRAGTTTAVALVEESLEAVRRHNGPTNAFITVHETTALEAARVADQERTRGLDRGPLHGIPLSLKDLIDEAGQVTTAASHVLDDRRATADAPLVARLRKAGAIILGRTNLHQFALGTTSEDSSFGPVRHPRDASRSAGGSSGGAAVAVATGMGLGSIGTDTGGSIRIPASVCGVVGVKPSVGEVPTQGVIPLSTTLDHAGPLAQSVQDAAWMLDIIAGRPPRMVESAPVAGLRVGRVAGAFDAPVDPTIRARVEAELEDLRSGGAVVTEVTLPGDDAIMAHYVTIVLREAFAWHAPYLDTQAGGYVPTVRQRLALGRTITEAAYAEALAFCATLRSAVDALFTDHDVLLLPTLPIVAPPIGAADVVPDPATGVSLPVRVAMLKHTQPFNMSGHPAVSLPLPTPGLPAGLQLVGPLGQTSRLLSVALAVEARLARTPAHAAR